ncbi:HAD-like protein [Hyaloscypha variabilis]
MGVSFSKLKTQCVTKRPSPQNTILLFSLDNTLFDHHHSMTCGLRAAFTMYPHLEIRTHKTFPELAMMYDHCQNIAYNRYLRNAYSNTYSNANANSYTQKDDLNIRLFFQFLRLPPPTQCEIKEFRERYREAYRVSRRAVVGALETLRRLRESGVRMAVVTNGVGEVEREKVEAIGVAELVECVVVSEEVGVMKLDGSGRIFEVAMERMGVERGECVCFVVGESVEADVEGALSAGLTPVLFDPEALVAFTYEHGPVQRCDELIRRCRKRYLSHFTLLEI